MTDTLTQINTTDNAPAGVNNNPVAGGPGVAGGNASESFGNDSFLSNGVNELVLQPQANGGGGTTGVGGNNGTLASSTIVNTITVYGSGGSGGSGGNGGDDGLASISLTNINAGSSATPSTTGVEINATANGGNAGGFNEGGNGAGGGSAGQNSTTSDGGRGGDGGKGGNGGMGGSSTIAVSGFVSYDSGSPGTDLAASVTGGVGGVSGEGASGSQGGTPSVGGEGGNGGAGGSVVNTLSNSTVVDNSSIFVLYSATAGAGAAGGQGGGAGYGQTVTNGDFDTDVYGVNGEGGNGGAGGNATITMSSDTMTAPNITMHVTVSAGTGSAGGGSPSEASTSGVLNNTTGSPSGATGAAGAEGTGNIVFTGNTITVGEGLTGPIFNQPGNLSLDLSIINRGTTVNTTQNLNGGSGGNLQFFGNDFVGGGNSTLNLGLGGMGSVIIDTNAHTIGIAGSPGNAITGFSTLDLDTNNTVIAGAGSLTLNFAADPDTLIYTPNSGTVEVNAATTTNMLLEFQGFSGLTATTLQNDTTVTGGNTFINLGAGQQIELTGFTSAIPSNEFSIQCFRSGTAIATRDGMVAVEDLSIGDLVTTHDGEALPIRWIGHRRFNFHGRSVPETVLPVRIAAHAFGENLPRRDLHLSPDHAIYAEGVLIPVKYLIDGAAIARVVTDDVTYYHVELDRHAVMMAEGLPAESYLDAGDRGFFTGEDRQVVSHPSRVAMIREAASAAPLCVTGPVLDRVRHGLASRVREAA